MDVLGQLAWWCLRSTDLLLPLALALWAGVSKMLVRAGGWFRCEGAAGTRGLVSTPLPTSMLPHPGLAGPAPFKYPSSPSNTHFSLFTATS